jgi:type IV pilus assembly protein PilC
VPEKLAKGFAEAEKGQTFEIKKEGESTGIKPQEKQIRLEISGARGGKILLRGRAEVITLTGNPVIDTFRRINQYLVSSTKIKIRDKATVFRLLAVMLNAGLPLIKSLNTLGVQQQKNPKLSGVLFDLAHQIEGGKSLSVAMMEHSDIFDDAQIGVIKAGEASGQLNVTLRSLAEEIEKSASVQGKIKGALIYPAVIMTLLFAVIFLMMIMVVPQMTQLFTQGGHELPLPTKILIGISDFSIAYWPAVVIGLFGTFFGISAWKKTRTGKYIWDAMLLKLPIFGPVIQKGALSKFARSFSNMMASGVPIIKSIEIVAYAVGNEVYKRRLLLTAEDMKRGIPMAENMAESKLFPKILVNMIEVGEQTAQLETVVLKVADFYDEEINEVVNSLTKIMEPLILVIIGLTVGGLVAAIMLPIIQLTDIAGSS